MKKIVFALLFAAPLSLLAQKVEFKDIPEGVKTTHNLMYKDVKDAIWEKKGETYLTNFVFNEMKTEVIYQMMGNKLSTRYEMPAQYIPVKITDYITKNYKGFKVTKFEMIDGQEGKLYIVSVKQKKAVKDLYFSLGGDFVKDGSIANTQPTQKPEETPASPPPTQKTENPSRH